MDRLITTKFGRLKQNHIPWTKHMSESKSEVRFQYGGRPFSESWGSFISAVDWDIPSKFGIFRLLKRIVDDTSETAKINFINSGTVDKKCVLYPWIWVDEINIFRFRCVINDGPYTLL